MPSRSGHGVGFDSFSSTSTGQFYYHLKELINRYGTYFCPLRTAVESLSEMTPETRAESGIEFETIETDVVRFRSSGGHDIDVITDLAERSSEAKEGLQNEPEGGMGYIQVNLNSTTIHLAIKWHLYTHRHLGLWDDQSSSIPPSDWIRRHFQGLDEALMRGLLSAAIYFNLKGLYHTVNTDLRSRSLLPWPFDNESEESTTTYSNNKVCFRSSDGQDVYVLKSLAQKSPEVKARSPNTFGDAMSHDIHVDFSSVALRLCIKWFCYSQRLQDIWDEEFTTLPTGRDDWVRRNFLSQSEALMSDLLRAVDCFELRGLHRTISDDMKARNMMPNEQAALES